MPSLARLIFLVLASALFIVPNIVAAEADAADKQCRAPTVREAYNKEKPPYPATYKEKRGTQTITITNLYQMPCEDVTNGKVAVKGKCDAQNVCGGKQCLTTSGSYEACKKTDVPVQQTPGQPTAQPPADGTTPAGGTPSQPTIPTSPEQPKADPPLFDGDVSHLQPPAEPPAVPAGAAPSAIDVAKQIEIAGGADGNIWDQWFTPSTPGDTPPGLTTPPGTDASMLSPEPLSPTQQSFQTDGQIQLPTDTFTPVPGDTSAAEPPKSWWESIKDTASNWYTSARDTVADLFTPSPPLATDTPAPSIGDIEMPPPPTGGDVAQTPPVETPTTPAPAPVEQTPAQPTTPPSQLPSGPYEPVAERFLETRQADLDYLGNKADTAARQLADFIQDRAVEVNVRPDGSVEYKFTPDDLATVQQLQQTARDAGQELRNYVDQSDYQNVPETDRAMYAAQQTRLDTLVAQYDAQTQRDGLITQRDNALTAYEANPTPEGYQKVYELNGQISELDQKLARQEQAIRQYETAQSCLQFCSEQTRSDLARTMTTPGTTVEESIRQAGQYGQLGEWGKAQETLAAARQQVAEIQGQISAQRELIDNPNSTLSEIRAAQRNIGILEQSLGAAEVVANQEVARVALTEQRMSEFANNVGPQVQDYIKTALSDREGWTLNNVMFGGFVGRQAIEGLHSLAEPISGAISAVTGLPTTYANFLNPVSMVAGIGDSALTLGGNPTLNRQFSEMSALSHEVTAIRIMDVANVGLGVVEPALRFPVSTGLARGIEFGRTADFAGTAIARDPIAYGFGTERAPVAAEFGSRATDITLSPSEYRPVLDSNLLTGPAEPITPSARLPEVSSPSIAPELPGAVRVEPAPTLPAEVQSFPAPRFTEPPVVEAPSFTPSPAQLAEISRPLVSAEVPPTPREVTAIAEYNRAVEYYSDTQARVGSGVLPENSAHVPASRDQFIAASRALEDLDLMARPAPLDDVGRGIDSIYRASTGEILAERPSSLGIAVLEEPYRIVGGEAAPVIPVESRPLGPLGPETPIEPFVSPSRPVFSTGPETFATAPAREGPSVLTIERPAFREPLADILNPNSLPVAVERPSITPTEKRAIDFYSATEGTLADLRLQQISPRTPLFSSYERQLRDAAAELNALGLRVEPTTGAIEKNDAVVAVHPPVVFPGQSPYMVVATVSESDSGAVPTPEVPTTAVASEVVPEPTVSVRETVANIFDRLGLTSVGTAIRPSEPERFATAVPTVESVEPPSVPPTARVTEDLLPEPVVVQVPYVEPETAFSARVVVVPAEVPASVEQPRPIAAPVQTVTEPTILRIDVIPADEIRVVRSEDPDAPIMRIETSNPAVRALLEEEPSSGNVFLYQGIRPTDPEVGNIPPATWPGEVVSNSVAQALESPKVVPFIAPSLDASPRPQLVRFEVPAGTVPSIAISADSPPVIGAGALPDAALAAYTGPVRNVARDGTVATSDRNGHPFEAVPAPLEPQPGLLAADVPAPVWNTGVTVPRLAQAAVLAFGLLHNPVVPLVSEAQARPIAGSVAGPGAGISGTPGTRSASSCVSDWTCLSPERGPASQYQLDGKGYNGPGVTASGYMPGANDHLIASQTYPLGTFGKLCNLGNQCLYVFVGDTGNFNQARFSWTKFDLLPQTYTKIGPSSGRVTMNFQPLGIAGAPNANVRQRAAEAAAIARALNAGIPLPTAVAQSNAKILAYAPGVGNTAIAQNTPPQPAPTVVVPRTVTINAPGSTVPGSVTPAPTAPPTIAINAPGSSVPTPTAPPAPVVEVPVLAPAPAPVVVAEAPVVVPTPTSRPPAVSLSDAPAPLAIESPAPAPIVVAEAPIPAPLETAVMPHEWKPPAVYIAEQLAPDVLPQVVAEPGSAEPITPNVVKVVAVEPTRPNPVVDAAPQPAPTTVAQVPVPEQVPNTERIALEQKLAGTQKNIRNLENSIRPLDALAARVQATNGAMQASPARARALLSNPGLKVGQSVAAARGTLATARQLVAAAQTVAQDTQIPAASRQRISGLASQLSASVAKTEADLGKAKGYETWTLPESYRPDVLAGTTRMAALSGQLAGAAQDAIRARSAPLRTQLATLRTEQGNLATQIASLPATVPSDGPAPTQVAVAQPAPAPAPEPTGVAPTVAPQAPIVVADIPLPQSRPAAAPEPAPTSVAVAEPPTTLYGSVTTGRQYAPSVQRQLISRFGLTEVPQRVAAQMLPPSPVPYAKALPAQTNPLFAKPVGQLTDAEIISIIRTSEKAIQDYWEKAFQAQGYEYRRVDVVIIDSRSKTNLEEGERPDDRFIPLRGVVQIDMNAVRAAAIDMKGAKGVVAAFSVGHEIGHYIQRLTNVDLKAIEKNIFANDPGPLAQSTGYRLAAVKEIQADKLAGIALSESGLLGRGDPEHLYYYVASSGDDIVVARYGASVEPLADMSHGRATDRAQAFYDGLLSPRVDTAMAMLGTRPDWSLAGRGLPWERIAFPPRDAPIAIAAPKLPTQANPAPESVPPAVIVAYMPEPVIQRTSPATNIPATYVTPLMSYAPNALPPHYTLANAVYAPTPGVPLSQARSAVAIRPREPEIQAGRSGPALETPPLEPLPPAPLPAEAVIARETALRDPVVNTDAYLNFPRLPLNGPDGLVQEAAIAKYLADTDGMIQQYESHFGTKIVNPDLARLLFRDIGYAGTNSSAVQKVVTDMTDRLWDRALAANPEPNVVLYTGSAGAGKSSTLEFAKERFPNIVADAAVILDGTLSNAAVAEARIGQALAAGKHVEIINVYREPIDAWNNGVMSRLMDPASIDTGRVVPIPTFVMGYKRSLDIVKSLIANPRPNVSVSIIDNSRGAQNVGIMSTEDFLRTRYSSSVERTIRAQTLELLESGRITPDQYAAITGAEAPARLAVALSEPVVPIEREVVAAESAQPVLEAAPTLAEVTRLESPAVDLIPEPPSSSYTAPKISLSEETFLARIDDVIADLRSMVPREAPQIPRGIVIELEEGIAQQVVNAEIAAYERAVTQLPEGFLIAYENDLARAISRINDGTRVLDARPLELPQRVLANIEAQLDERLAEINALARGAQDVPSIPETIASQSSLWQRVRDFFASRRAQEPVAAGPEQLSLPLNEPAQPTRSPVVTVEAPAPQPRQGELFPEEQIEMQFPTTNDFTQPSLPLDEPVQPVRAGETPIQRELPLESPPQGQQLELPLQEPTQPGLLARVWERVVAPFREGSSSPQPARGGAVQPIEGTNYVYNPATGRTEAVAAPAPSTPATPATPSSAPTPSAATRPITGTNYVLNPTTGRLEPAPTPAPATSVGGGTPPPPTPPSGGGSGGSGGTPPPGGGGSAAGNFGSSSWSAAKWFGRNCLANKWGRRLCIYLPGGLGLYAYLTSDSSDTTAAPGPFTVPTTPGGPGGPPVIVTTPPGTTPPAQTPPGQTPPGTTPPGTTPPGQTPPGTTPPGTTPPGTTPPGQTPPGQTPPGQTPPGQTPPGQTPPGQTPSPQPQPQPQPQPTRPGTGSGIGGGIGNLIGALMKAMGLGGASSQPSTPTTPTTPSVTPSGTSTTTKAVVALVANPKEVRSGGTSVLWWASVGTTECAVFGPDQTRIATGTMSGRATTSPISTSTPFSVRCEAKTGENVSATTTVSVLR